MPRLSLQYFWNMFACLFLCLLLAAGAQGDEWPAYDSKLSGDSSETAIFEAFAKKVPASPKMVRSQGPAKRAIGKPRMKWGGIRSVKQVKNKRNKALVRQSGKRTSTTKFRKKNFGRNSKSLAQRRVTPPKRVTRAFRNSPAAKTRGTSKSRSALPNAKSSKQVPAYLQRKMKSSNTGNNTSKVRPRSTGEKIAGGHAFNKHVLERGEFAGLIKTRKQFADHIEKVINNPTATKQLSKGRTAYWHEATRTVVIKDPKTRDGGTAFQPTHGRAYYDTLR